MESSLYQATHRTVASTIPESARRSIRPFQDTDEADVVGVWHRSGLAAYTYLPTWQALTIETARSVFHNIIRAECAIWVGTLDQHIVAYLAMNGSYLDRLYVDPSEWRKGWGMRFIILAKQLSPGGLELHTHQENWAARVLYERHALQGSYIRHQSTPPSPRRMLSTIGVHSRPTSDVFSGDWGRQQCSSASSSARQERSHTSRRRRSLARCSCFHS